MLVSQFLRGGAAVPGGGSKVGSSGFLVWPEASGGGWVGGGTPCRGSQFPPLGGWLSEERVRDKSLSSVLHPSWRSHTQSEGTAGTVGFYVCVRERESERASN